MTKWVEDGEPYAVPWDKDVKETCCDCGLVHRASYTLNEDKQLVIRTWRMEEDNGKCNS